MLHPADPLAELLRRDSRYHFDSYVFVFESLRFAQESLNMGRVAASSAGHDSADDAVDYDEELDALDDLDDEEDEVERHVTGQDLCEAIRRFALREYGLLARCVLNHWGVHCTKDFGEIVFNLIDIGKMRKTDRDRREDFADVYDFSEALTDGCVFRESVDSEESAD